MGHPTGRAGVFIDRDGTLNIEVDYLRSPDQLQLISGAAESIRKLNDSGLVTCVISNQSGVARGFLSERDLVGIHARLREMLLSAGATLDRIYYCPHHPTAGIEPYRIDCPCRKPKPGMLMQGAREFGLELQRCFVVGDSIVDIQAGNAVNATTILVRTGYGTATEQSLKREGIPVSTVVPSIVEAVEYILETLKGDKPDND